MSYFPLAGFPKTFNDVAVVPAPATADAARLSFGADSCWLDITATTNAVRVYFRVGDFEADSHYYEVAAGATWSGPYRARAVYLRSLVGAATVDVVAALVVSNVPL